MKKNIIANLAGRFWGILSNFIFIPLYIKYLGFESYSVISFTLTITGIMTVLDAGLTAILSREFARKDISREEKFRIFKSLEAAYLLVVLLCISLIFISATYIGYHWIHVKSYDPDEITLFIKIIGFEIGFQLLMRFYMGGLMGIEKQVEANVYQIGWGILRNGLIIVGIIFIPSLLMFFIWQTVSTILFTLLFKIVLQRSISNGSVFAVSFKIEKTVIAKVGKFAGGMMLIVLVAAINTQLDKLTISKVLSLENLGYYTLAVSISQGLLILINPISAALLPRFTAYYSEKKTKEATVLFSKFSLLVSILVFSIMMNLSIFSSDLIWIWTGKRDVTEKTFQLVPITALAYSMLSLQLLPYNIAISNAYTKLNNILGLISLFITIPGYILATMYYGVIGAASVFCFVQIVTAIVYLYFINLKFLKLNFFVDIFLQQIIFPLLVSSIITFGFYLLPNYFKVNRFLDLLWIGFSTIITLFVTTIFFIPIAELKRNLPPLKLKKNG
ncbi:oligosaccharide flippase family protein [Flavobacterium columnare]|uniref:Polysaccharide biosynthesis protein n=1 Tax=Flavobacterium columnare TaxID=996 RepID=A0AAI8CI45_9FLAO|nr:oligosaccharide flippase family protein [Flavobacterium columnare]AMO21157.2 hypothetical protein UN65_13190 [Flavobacterium columnare]QOG58255.1 oligosaccharide flippase family protein [Flavobacterium columnare]QOG60978.1 oligosaccharide flippase family protein [Flavobacterium columnare]QOG63698.1 oligosaccharide flippase family protein [Flavobacterium columnare]QOG66422.1 oligosaccharide flippase family protein [Flavobacterium columnare]